MAPNGQMWPFRGHFWCKNCNELPGESNNNPKMTKSADTGADLAMIGPKSLIFLGVTKIVGTLMARNQ